VCFFECLLAAHKFGLISLCQLSNTITQMMHLSEQKLFGLMGLVEVLAIICKPVSLATMLVVLLSLVCSCLYLLLVLRNIQSSFTEAAVKQLFVDEA
jgi:hypothetical protein